MPPRDGENKGEPSEETVFEKENLLSDGMDLVKLKEKDKKYRTKNKKG